MADLRIGGITDASQMLEGRVAGVTVDNVSGTFGANPKIRIRGNTTINGDTQPLMVVDGVILEDLNAVSANDIITGNANTLTTSSIAGLNPDDIQSYQVLKDASATASIWYTGKKWCHCHHHQKRPKRSDACELLW